MKQSGAIAGLNILHIISAPAASALFYGQKRLGLSNMVIFDLGAGTLDVAAVTIKDNACNVVATAGDIHLGGSDFDNNLIDHFVNLVKKSKKEDISSIPEALSNLRTFCEKAKISLSSDSESMVPVKIRLYNDIALDFSITETEFRAVNKDLFSKCINIINKCLRDAKMSIVAVHEVILVGGSTRIPLLQSKISDFFKGKELNMDPSSEASVAYGAAFQAFDLSNSINGRGLHCLSLLDVAPFSLGLQSPQGEMLVFVPRNTNIPTKMKKTMKYRNPNRTIIYFEVYEGEERLAEQINLLGKFELPATHFSLIVGHQIDVTFEVHGDGTLTVMAEDIFRGTRNDITITPNDTEDSRRRVWEALIQKNRKYYPSFINK